MVQLGRNQVLTHRANVLPRRDRCQDFQASVPQILDVLGHDHSVRLGRQSIAGVDPTAPMRHGHGNVRAR
jgi:hypothetical protein